MKYTEIASDGELVGWGDCGACDVPASDDETRVLRGVAPPTDRRRRWRWDGQAFVDAGPRFPTTYVTQRLSSYPPATEQLDMLWHAMADGATPKIEPWFSTIKAIKDAYPKP